MSAHHILFFTDLEMTDTTRPGRMVTTEMIPCIIEILMPEEMTHLLPEIHMQETMAHPLTEDMMILLRQLQEGQQIVKLLLQVET